MSKHTPGPWSWTGTRANPNLYSYLMGGKEGCEPVGAALSGFTGDDANAKLIAAAPDLLDALNKVLAQTGWHHIGDEALGKAQSAIAKATGES